MQEKAEELNLNGPPAERYANPHSDVPIASRFALEDIARICHEVNRAYCTALGDNSQLPWEQAPQWQKDSAMSGVFFVLDHPDAPASSNHIAWLEDKRRNGWKYGPKKDPEKKEHPCFVPYDDLPVDQRAKDHIFRAIVLNVTRL